MAAAGIAARRWRVFSAVALYGMISKGAGRAAARFDAMGAECLRDSACRRRHGISSPRCLRGGFAKPHYRQRDGQTTVLFGYLSRSPPERWQ